MSLIDRRIVIIGGSSGIGLMTAKEAVARGARVVIGGRTAERLADAAKIGGNVETHQVDATDEAAMANFFANIGRFDHLAVLVPSAPDKTVSAKFAPFLDMNPLLFETVFRNRFWSQCWGARYGAPRMNRDGSIVFMSSSQPRKTIPRYSASCAAAGAIEALACSGDAVPHGEWLCHRRRARYRRRLSLYLRNPDNQKRSTRKGARSRLGCRSAAMSATRRPVTAARANPYWP